MESKYFGKSGYLVPCGGNTFIFSLHYFCHIYSQMMTCHYNNKNDISIEKNSLVITQFQFVGHFLCS
jgi:hypothetical protein